MSILTDSRIEICAAITGLGAKVYDYVPATPMPPALVVMPAETWVTPGRIGSRQSVEAFWKITAIVAPRKNDAATVDLEELATGVLGALPDAYQLVRIGAPQVTDFGGQGSNYTMEITVSAHLKET